MSRKVMLRPVGIVEPWYDAKTLCAGSMNPISQINRLL